MIAQLQRQSAQVLSDHLTRYRVDCRLADLQHQAWPGDRADASTGAEADARLGAQSNPGEQQCTVGHVRVVTCILDRAGLGPVIQQPAEFQAHLYALALGQDDVDGIRVGTTQQQSRSGQTGGGGAATSGQAAAQRGGMFSGFVTHRQA
ncbi:hypothetical protein D3C73_1129090 [compost metagenome]